MQGEIAATTALDPAAQRRAMVDGQIRTFDVTDTRVIAAFDVVPRERFLPVSLAPLAYSDAVLTLRNAEGRPVRVLMQPMHLARLVQGVAIEPTDRVLVVAGGAGYGAAIVRELAASVVSLESDPALTEAAQVAFGAEGRAKAKAVTGPLAEGFATDAPYDVILVLGAVETGLDRLFAQLTPSGVLGTIEAAPEDTGGRVGRAMLYRRVGADVSARALFDVTLPVLPEFRRAPTFVF